MIGENAIIFESVLKYGRDVQITKNNSAKNTMQDFADYFVNCGGGGGISITPLSVSRKSPKSIEKGLRTLQGK